jgi:hypothetical protein
MKNRYLSQPMAALISVVLLIVALSAQSRSPEFQSHQWRFAGQNLATSGASRQNISLTARSHPTGKGSDVSKCA